MTVARLPRVHPATGAVLGLLATDCLLCELATYPKPGLISHVDNGAHHDMDGSLLRRSAETLAPWFAMLWQAGAIGQGMDRLRAIGIDAERDMMAATDGVNTHRGAIFGLGLLCAAAGVAGSSGMLDRLGAIVASRWGDAIMAGPKAVNSHGAAALRHYGAGGARAEAATGFPSVYAFGLPGLVTGRELSGGDEEAARVQACMSLIANVDDTNLLHRGGPEGLAFAKGMAFWFLDSGGVGADDWRSHARMIHDAFVARRLSPGGSADLLAMTLFVDRVEN